MRKGWRNVIGGLVIAVGFAMLASMCSDAFADDYYTSRIIGTEAEQQPLKGTEILSAEEILALEDALHPYYGFFISEFPDGTWVKWRDVIYNGAGIAGSLTDKQREDLYNDPGYSGGMDTTIIFGDKLRDYVRRTTGTEYAEANRPLDWGYVEEDDFYYFSHGDTNGSMVPPFVYAERDGDTYFIYYSSDDWRAAEDYPERTDRTDYGCRMTVKKTEDGWKFLSNLEVTDETEKAVFIRLYEGEMIDPLTIPAISPAIKKGDLVRLGHYEQDAEEEDGPEDIIWRVLKTEDGKAFLLSEYILEYKYWEAGFDTKTYEECSLRKWLNEDFYNDAFNQDEQSVVAITHVIAEDNLQNQVDAGKDTYDRIFLLSLSEAEELFENEQARIASETADVFYRYQKLALYHPTEWALRTPGCVNTCISFVDTDGTIEEWGTGQTQRTGIRPAMWVKY